MRHVYLKSTIQSAILILLGLWSATAGATTFANRPLGVVIKEAPYIIRGKTRDSYSDWGRGERQRTLFTYTDFDVTEVLKGKVQETHLLLRQPGGQKDGIEMHVPGTARFTRDEDVVVLVTPKDSTDQAYEVLNFAAGKYNVITEGQEVFLENSLGTGEVYTPGVDPHHVSYNSRISLKAFKQVIQDETAVAAQQPQFKVQQNSQKQNPHDEGKTHHETPSPATANPPEGSHTLSAEAHNSHWIIISFIGILLGGAIGLWIIFGRRSGPS